MQTNPKPCCLLIGATLALTTAAVSAGAGHAQVREYEREFTTYPYSDPDPVPAMTRYYPYFRYDGFTDQPVQKKWKVVELSNDYIQALILPEVGGKVWAAIERKSGRPFVYFNQVVKFRDVSMRGPWTSGGMEANYGIIGHTPNCFSPVDYVARTNADGSVSCIIGTLDLLTRTVWRLDIQLPADEACLNTRSFWHNGSGAEQPYYTWMNIGMKADGKLQFVNHGTRYLGHDGKVFDWPINPANGHDLSWYDQNNFGPYKSYHVYGRLAEFFGCYYHDDDFGMAHCADYGDKPGRKVWIWGLSRQGMIWERLLTDTNRQYIEVQSGRLFNQTADESSVTPFKHKEFPPYATDTWTESWQPVAGTKGFVSASPWGAMNVTREGQDLVIRISPSRPLKASLEVRDGEARLWAQDVGLKPLQLLEKRVRLATEPKSLQVALGGDKLTYDASGDDELSRPLEAPANFDWNTDYGWYLKGIENCRERAYPQALTNFQACLKVNPNYTPALAEMAALANRRADFPAALAYARRALSIDTYDAGANYQFGIASAATGRSADAKAAFAVAALSAGWRSAADTELARLFLREKHLDRAWQSAEASLDYNRRNLDALQIQVCIARLRGDKTGAEAVCQTLFGLDPLNHFARFEQVLRGKLKPAAFTGLIRNELPQETYLELALWYHSAGLDADAIRLLELAPPVAEVAYWLAYLHRDAALLARAEAVSPAFALPFRAESAAVFAWAKEKSPAWQASYYLALIRWSQGDLAVARELLTGCGNTPGYGPFYAARAQVCEETAAADLRHAVELDPGQWRYGVLLTKFHLAHTNAPAALEVAARQVRLFPGNTTLALLYAKTLVLNGKFEEVTRLLPGLNILPCEGSTDARTTLREACLMLAVAQLNSGAPAEALRLIAQARQWPENLGVGKPYPEDNDERLEDWLNYQCSRKAGDLAEAQKSLAKLLAWDAGSKPEDSGALVRALAMQAAGRAPEGQNLLESWRTRSTDPAMAVWAEDVFAGKAVALPANVSDPVCRVIAAWLKLGKP